MMARRYVFNPNIVGFVLTVSRHPENGGGKMVVAIGITRPVA
jgi:hypothetical protein